MMLGEYFDKISGPVSVVMNILEFLAYMHLNRVCVNVTLAAPDIFHSYRKKLKYIKPHFIIIASPVTTI